jgi:hypothetical protein
MYQMDPNSITAACRAAASCSSRRPVGLGWPGTARLLTMPWVWPLVRMPQLRRARSEAGGSRFPASRWMSWVPDGGLIR